MTAKDTCRTIKAVPVEERNHAGEQVSVMLNIKFTMLARDIWHMTEFTVRSYCC